MMIVDPFTAQLQSAVLAYFAGERQELWLTLGLSLLVSVLVTCLWLSSRTGFAAALALTTVVTTGLLAGGAASLLNRDSGLASSIVQSLGTDQQAAAWPPSVNACRWSDRSIATTASGLWPLAWQHCCA